MNSIVDKNNFSIEKFHEVVPSDQDRYEHIQYACDQTTIDGVILEFGVWKAKSTNCLASKFHNEIIYGFDSFEGLPEDWFLTKTEEIASRPKGYFKKNSLPKIRKNICLVKGWFNETIPVWLSNTSIKQVKLIHIDCDLYSSTKQVLSLLTNYIVPGTVIIFDEFFPWDALEKYETWEEHEYKALKEWVEQNNIKFSVISRNNKQQCSIKIL